MTGAIITADTVAWPQQMLVVQQHILLQRLRQIQVKLKVVGDQYFAGTAIEAFNYLIVCGW